MQDMWSYFVFIFERANELTFRVLFTKLADELGVSVGFRSSSQRRKISHRQAYLQFEQLADGLSNKLLKLLDEDEDFDEESKFYENLRDVS